jgi:glutathione S-transferase
MILFYTPNSPYARTARIALREWGVLEVAEERPAANREADNPVLQFSPVGRVPTLVHADLVITEAQSVFAYIKDFAGAGNSERMAQVDWATVAEEGQVVGFLEGIAFWVRENRRALEARSDFLLKVERDRMLRCLNYLDCVFH